MRRPVLQTLVFDDRFGNAVNVFYYQGRGSASATQFPNVQATVAPEPSSIVLLATGLAGAFGVTRHRRKQSVV